MPIQMEIFHPDRLVLGVGRGEVNLAEYAKFLGDIIQAGVLHYRKIIDLTQITARPIGVDPFLAVDERLREYSVERRGPLALVVDDEQSALAETFKALTSRGRPVEVFHSIHDARRWLAKQPIKE